MFGSYSSYLGLTIVSVYEIPLTTPVIKETRTKSWPLNTFYLPLFLMSSVEIGLAVVHVIV